MEIAVQTMQACYFSLDIPGGCSFIAHSLSLIILGGELEITSHPFSSALVPLNKDYEVKCDVYVNM